LDDETKNDVYMQLFTESDSSGFSIYEAHWDNKNELNDSLEGEIDNLLESAKRINQGIAKIETKINQIKDICQEYELEFCEFITLEYNFDL
jgi:chromosome segregation ATPase